MDCSHHAKDIDIVLMFISLHNTDLTNGQFSHFSTCPVFESFDHWSAGTLNNILKISLILYPSAYFTFVRWLPTHLCLHQKNIQCRRQYDLVDVSTTRSIDGLKKNGLPYENKNANLVRFNNLQRFNNLHHFLRIHS